MTKTGYVLVLVLFGSIAIGGVVAVAPTGRGLAYTRTMSCDDFMRAPEALERVRLEGCFVQTGLVVPVQAVDGRGIERAEVDFLDYAEPRPIVWITEDDRMRSLAQRLWVCEGDPHCFARLVARSPEPAVIETTIEGTVTLVTRGSSDPRVEGRSAGDWPDDGRLYVIDGRPERSMRRPVGMFFLLIGILGVVFFVRAQRRWNARRAALTGSGARPLEF